MKQSNAKVIEMVQNFTNTDPWPNLPTQFLVRAAMINDGQEIAVYLPGEFVGYRVSLAGPPNHRTLHLTSSTNEGLLVESCVDIEGDNLTGRIQMSAEITDTPMKRAWKSSRPVTRRTGARIYVDTLFDYMAVNYTPKFQERPTPVDWKPEVPKPTTVIRETDTMSEVKAAVVKVNEAVQKHGIKLTVREDGTLSAVKEF